jgi:hypothetical protein
MQYLLKSWEITRQVDKIQYLSLKKDLKSMNADDSAKNYIYSYDVLKNKLIIKQ